MTKTWFGVFHFFAVMAFSPTVLAMGEHDFHFETRLRHAYVEFSRVGEEDLMGRGVSGLFRLGVTSEWNDLLKTTIEFDYVETGLQDHHSDFVRFNGKPSILDAPGYEFNEAFVTFGFSWADINLGRQKVNLGNQRFVGSNWFWQNEQSFDGASASVPLLSSSRLIYHYVNNVNSIFGNDADVSLKPDDINYAVLNGRRPGGLLGDQKHNTHLLHLDVKDIDFTTISSYFYSIENDDSPRSSNQTLGASYEYERKWNRIKYMGRIEAALQEQHQIENAEQTSYYFTSLGVGYGRFETSVRYEVFDSNGEQVFITPLSSIHDFDGWADAAPKSVLGLQDLSLRVLWRKAPFKIDARYHTFSAEEVEGTFGHEYDVDFIYKPFRHHKVHLRLAKFEVEDDFVGRFDTFRSYFTYTYSI